MHGIITSYDLRKQAGWIQGDNGQIYDFKRQDLQKAEDESYLRMDVHVDFTPAPQANANGKFEALDLTISNIEECQNKTYYQEPTDMPVFEGEFVEGYDILDRGIYRIERRDRTEEKAMHRLKYDCQQVKANAIAGYKCTSEMKNSFGNGFLLYTASGVPVVLGKPHADGECTEKELKNRIDQNKVKKLHSVIVNTRIGKMVIKGVGALLLLIFVLGFVLTGGV